MSSVELGVEEPATADLLGTPVFVVARRDGEVGRALANAALAFPDGWPIAWLERRLGHRSAARVPGPDLMARVIEEGRGFGIRHFLLGSTEDVLRRLEGNLARRFPGAEIVG